MWKSSRVLEDFSGNIDKDVVSAAMDDYETNEEEYSMFPHPPAWDNMYDMDNHIVAPIHTMGPVISKNTYLKYYTKTALDARNMAANAYHDSSVLKIPPEEQVGKVKFVEHVVESLAA
eukprot:12467872-Ditylum_brightwellii.AAC.1